MMKEICDKPAVMSVVLTGRPNLNTLGFVTLLLITYTIRKKKLINKIISSIAMKF
jgi:hypothetical protein